MWIDQFDLSATYNFERWLIYEDDIWSIYTESYG